MNLYFVHDDNAGERPLFTNRQELLSNLARNVGGISWAWGENPGVVRNGLGCGVFWCLGGLGFLVGTILLLVNIFSDPATTLAHFPIAVITASLGITLAFGLGYFYLARAFLVILHSDYAAYLLENLIVRGTVIEGEIISSKLTANQNQELEYRFFLPETDKIVTGVYITSTRKSMQPGYKVSVLFLDQYIHVLL